MRLASRGCVDGHRQRQGRRSRDRGGLPTAGHLDPEVLPAGDGQEEGEQEQPGRVRAAPSAMPRSRRCQARQGQHQADEAEQALDADARAGHLTTRVPPSTRWRTRADRPWHRTGRDRRGRSHGPPPGTGRGPDGARVATARGPGHGAGPATTTGSNWVPARRSTSSRASSTGRAARSAFGRGQRLECVGDSDDPGEHGDVVSRIDPAGYPRPSKRSWWMLDAVERRREELDVPHDLRAARPDAAGCWSRSTSLRPSTLRRMRLGTARMPTSCSMPA